MLLTLISADTVAQRFSEGLQMALVGMLVVFSALWLTSIVISLLNRLDARHQAAAAKAAPPPAPPTHGLSQDKKRLIAVLTAAATTALGQDVQVNAVKQVN